MSLPLNIDVSQILLHAGNFVILGGGMYILLYKPVSDFMKKRRAHFEDLERQANESSQSASLLKAEYEDMLTSAKNDADVEYNKIIKKAKGDAENILNNAKKEAEGIINEAKAKAENDRKAIMEQLTPKISAMAKKAASYALDNPQGSIEEFIKSEEEQNEQ